MGNLMIEKAIPVKPWFAKLIRVTSVVHACTLNVVILSGLRTRLMVLPGGEKVL